MLKVPRERKRKSSPTTRGSTEYETLFDQHSATAIRKNALAKRVTCKTFTLRRVYHQMNHPNNSYVNKDMPDGQLNFLLENLCLDDQKHQQHPVCNPLDASLQNTMVHDSVVCSTRYSWDGQYVATACNLKAHMFDAETGNNLATFSEQTRHGDNASYVRSVCFTPDGKSLVTGGEDHMVRVWNLDRKTVKHRLEGHCADVGSVDVASNNRFHASASSDGSVKMWNLTTGNLMRTLRTDPTSLGVSSVSISPTCRYMAGACIDGTVLVWDVETSRVLQKLDGHERSVYSVTFSPCERLLLSASLDKTLKIWPMNASSPSRCAVTFAGHRDYVLCASFSPSGTSLFSGSKDQTVRRWDPRQPNVSLELQGHNSSVIAIAHSPTHSCFATACGDTRARTWLYNNTASVHS